MSHLHFHGPFTASNVALFLCKHQQRIFRVPFCEPLPKCVTLHARYSLQVDPDINADIETIVEYYGFDVDLNFVPGKTMIVEPLYKIEEKPDGRIAVVRICFYYEDYVSLTAKNWAEIRRWALGDINESSALKESNFWKRITEDDWYFGSDYDDDDEADSD